MAKKRPATAAASKRAVTRPPPASRAWRIFKTDGLDETVIAHTCWVPLNGVLAFYNLIPRARDAVLVRAFSPRDWHHVQIIDLSTAEAAQP